MQEFKGKVALITGGSRGIGRSIAIKLAEKGCNLAINYLSDFQSADETIAILKQFGIQAIALQAHVGDADSRRDLWKSFDAHFDHIDFLVANAATGVFREASKLSLNSLRKVFAVNFEGIFDLVNESVKRMPQVDVVTEPGCRGRIIAISSLGAERVIANYGSIGSSKAAMEAMMRQLAFELGPQGINCNVVRAGLVDTGILNFVPGRDRIISDAIENTPNGRLVKGEDVADLVSFMLSEQSCMINGQMMTVDGGYNLLA